MRLIDADVLKQHIDKLPALPDGNFAGNHSALKALINMQPTIESEPHWIPCSERLPEEDGRYLCDWQGMRVGTCYFHNGHFRIYGDIKDKYVTAWQPLPKPYEVEER